MSHLHEREEKVCLNCGAHPIGRYCQNCGQENLEPKESAWHLIVHFFNDFTHFDGQLFSTMKPLLAKPGFLSAEYMKGRRASYLNPIRMYLFISAVFFLLLTTFFLPVHQKGVKIDENNIQLKRKGLSVRIGTGLTEIGGELTETGRRLDAEKLNKNTRAIVLANGDRVTEGWVNTWSPPSINAYDSLQALLPEDERDGAFNRYFARKAIVSTNYLANHKDEAGGHIFEKFFHSLPYMLFFSLPVLALILRLLYIRRKEFNFVSHGIFILHYICVVFLAILLFQILNKFTPLGDFLYWPILIGLYVFLFKAMRNFYQQGWFKTLIKFILFWGRRHGFHFYRISCWRFKQRIQSRIIISVEKVRFLPPFLVFFTNNDTG